VVHLQGVKMIKCNNCSEEFDEMCIDSIELTYRYFTGKNHKYNNTGKIKLCKHCTTELFESDNPVTNVINKGFEDGNGN